jgi:hypothetical protein
MRHDDPRFVYSELSQSVTLDGITVGVQIFRLGDEDEWILEVTAEGTTTVWNEPFDTDAEALTAFQRVVQEEGGGTFLDNGGSETVH